MDNVPPVLPPAAELQQLEHTLAQVESHRAWLLTRRSQLLELLRQSGPGSAPATAAWDPPPGQRTPHPWRQDARPPTVQNVLLALGGVLLAVAVTAFTVLSWGHMGIGGRSAVLSALTLTAMGTPALLLRRQLAATAEAVACLGLVLLLLDAYALHQVALPGTDPADYSALASAAVAATWAAYGLWLRRPPSTRDAEETVDPPGAGARGLRLPLPVAVCLAQLPLLLWAVAAGAGPLGFASALLVTATADLAFALRTRERSVRLPAAVCASVTGIAGALLAAQVSVGADAPSGTARAAGLLLLAAALGVSASWRSAGVNRADGDDAQAAPPEADAPAPAARAEADAPAAPVVADAPAPAGPAAGAAAGSATGPVPRSALRPAAGAAAPAWPAAAGGLALIAAIGGFLRTAVPGSWAVLGYLLCAAGVLAAARSVTARAAVSAGLTVASGAVYAGAALWALPSVATALLGPVTWTGAVWSGAPAGARDALGPAVTAGTDVDWPGTGAVPAVLGVIAVTAMALHRWWASAPRPAAPAVAAVVAWCSVGVVLPVTLDLPHPVAVALLVAQVAVLLVASVTLASAHAVPAPSADSVPSSATGAPQAPGSPPAAPAVRARTEAASLTALLCAVATTLTAAFWSLAEQSVTLGALSGLLVVHAAASAAAGHVRQRATAAVASLCALALTVAVCAAAGLPPHRTAFAVLAVAAAASFVAARLRALPAGLAVECAGYAALLLAICLAARDLPVLASVLALAGVVASGTALRGDRRAAGHAAAALFVMAAWARLAASGVSAPEAYTLPVTAAALFVGVRRHRQDPTVSSWAAYGPGLGATFLPSLMAAWDDTHWTRPLLLGLGALAVTLFGARQRLRAPLLLGGTVLALIALHELAPYLVQVVDTLPRWLPPALAGLLLLATGATYEHRLRDARKLRDALGRMR
ncbi:SCO7613 C-terminal domain-containing membrane protein [Streptomyces sp. NPDC048639]|uniref:SCO7613 C-terminal domain-containing membrane protein n=1 Tax=Streptomyces sp. NPDC048639 TaxID=3365581 RepID=UPI0037135122